MPSNTDEGDMTLSPNDAFAVLGNETRINIIQELGNANRPIAFTDLRERVGIRDSGQFNYHLDQLDGHFVRKTEDGYVLRQAANRVVEAVLSGTVTVAARLEPAAIQAPCPYCGANIELSYREERMLLRCPECPGAYAGIESTSAAFPILPRGSIALYYLPPAGLAGRTRREMLDTVLDWTYSEHLAIDHGVCPRCSGRFEFAIEFCEDHDGSEPICDHCSRRYRALVRSECVNCNHFRVHMLTDYVFYRPGVRQFFEARNIDPILPDWDDMGAFYDLKEKMLSSNPFEAQLVYQVKGDKLEVHVDGELNITEVMEETATNSE